MKQARVMQRRSKGGHSARRISNTICRAGCTRGPAWPRRAEGLAIRPHQVTLDYHLNYHLLWISTGQRVLLYVNLIRDPSCGGGEDDILEMEDQL
jgi:hypothetical protein